MAVPGDGRPTAYAPRRAWSAVALAAVAGLVALAPGLDPAGRVLAAGGALLLLAVTCRDAVQRPVLEVVPPGLLLWSGVRRRLVAWEDVVAVRLGHERHWSGRGPVLELDLRDQDGDLRLVLLPARRLGADPAAVVALLTDLRGA